MKDMKMNNTALFLIIGCLLSIVACKQQSKEVQNERKQVYTTLFDKPLPEIKQLVNGRWELVEGKNARESSEYENTFITFDNDKYIWTEDGKDEPGDLNWRKSPTGNGYDAYIMDVFYAEFPAYPLALSGDTLYLQDISETGYRYTLVWD